MACHAENLVWVSALLDNGPTLMIDFSARIAELGRQPYSARRFFLRHADRILLGTDAGPDLATYARFVLSSATKNPNAAWAFVKFPTGEVGQSELSKLGFAVPIRESVAASDP